MCIVLTVLRRYTGAVAAGASVLGMQQFNCWCCLGGRGQYFLFCGAAAVVVDSEGHTYCAYLADRVVGAIVLCTARVKHYFPTCNVYQQLMDTE
jgi:hypothetical protein